MTTDLAVPAAPTGWPPNASDPGLNDNAGCEPVPARLTVCGESAASSEIVSVPDRLPVSVGVNVTPMKHLAPNATEVQPFDDTAKSPEATTEDTFSVAFPELKTLTGRAALG